MTGRWYYGWNVVAFGVFLQAFSIGVTFFCFPVLILTWEAVFAVDRREVLLGVTMLTVLLGVFSPIVGNAIDRFPIRWLVVGGGLVLGVGMSLLAAAQTYWQFILLWATLIPLGVVFSSTLCAQALAARWFERQRGLALGVVATGSALGGFAFPPILTAALGSMDWRPAYLLVSLVVCGCIVVSAWIVLRREPPAEKDGDAPAFAEPSQAPPAMQAAPPLMSTGAILKHPGFWAPAYGLMTLNFIGMGVQFNLVAYADGLGVAADRAALLISTLSIAMVTGNFIFGLLADRISHRVLFISAAVLLALMLLMLLNTASYQGLLAAAVLHGLGMGAVVPLIGAVFATQFGIAAFGRVVGLASVFVTFGAFSPPVAGWIYDQTGQYQMAFITYLGVLVPAAVLIRFLPSVVTRGAVTPS